MMSCRVVWILLAIFGIGENGAGKVLTIAKYSIENLHLRGGISKYYNHTAPSNRGGIFEEPKSGVPHNEGQSVWNKGGWNFEEVLQISPSSHECRFFT